MNCPRCRAENRDDSKFCGECGARLGPGPVAVSEGTSLTTSLDPPPLAPRPGTLVAGKYKVLAEIGHGGMGVVYKAEDLTLKRCVALKFLPAHLAAAPEFRERFVIEAQAAAALSHPNICVVHEVGESAGRPYIAMEFVEGETLHDKVRRARLEPGEAIGLVDQVAAGLGEAHGKGIVHRDIKSANIMVTPAGRAKVMDFGLAKLRGEASLTRSRTTVGTVAYMSPEQARGDAVDARTDIWSLGVVLYELLAGQLPFGGDHDQAVVYSILHRDPESLVKVRPGLGPALDHVVGHALAKRVADRYRTLEEFREDLAAVAEGLEPLKARARAAAVKLAVLPFANLTGDPNQEYLSDGLTQEMITLLGRLHPQGLGVIGRTSVMRYKKGDTSIDQIGRELGVDYVLEGSARREGNRVRVAADLVQVQDQVQLWGDVFEGEMPGILALQNDVAREVVKALALELLPAEQARLVSARPVNPEAHDAYLRSSFHWMKATPGDLDIAEKYVHLALEKDPAYAPAWAGRAWVWAVRGQMGYAPFEEAGPKARAAALKAIELDENLALAHEALGGIRTWLDWDWEGAWASWRRAIELNPNAATARALYAHFLMIMGRGDEALEHGLRAVELDPFNPLFHGWYAYVLYVHRRYEEAIVAGREALRLQPEFPIATSVLWLVMHEVEGMEKESFAFARSMARVLFDDTRIDTALDEGYARGGYAGGMKRAAEALIARLPEVFCKPYDIATFYALAGEKDRALEWLENAFVGRDQELPYLGCNPCFDDLRPDPRFQELLRKMKLPAITPGGARQP